MSQTAQTLALVGATLGAVVITFLGTAFLQHLQSRRGARQQLAAGIAELLAAAQDVRLGVAAIRFAHERRTKPRFYLRLVAMLVRDYPAPETWRDVLDLARIRPWLATALEADRYQLDESRTLAVDFATIVTTRANRYLTASALITLSDNKQIADAVRKLTAKVIEVMDAIGARKAEFERLDGELQKAMEDFRAVADRRLGNSR
jgi:hypothetical protein